MNYYYYLCFLFFNILLFPDDGLWPKLVVTYMKTFYYNTLNLRVSFLYFDSHQLKINIVNNYCVNNNIKSNY